MASKSRRRPADGRWRRWAWGLGLGALTVALLVAVALTGPGNTPPNTPSSPGSPEQSLPPLDEARVARGEKIYEAKCIGCHGPQGVGESPGHPQAVDEQGRYLAPPLDGSAHAWHHTDEELVEFIATGSPRNPRMKAWEGELSREEIRDVVEYIKSLWGPKERACQGPRHMDPDCFRGH